MKVRYYYIYIILYYMILSRLALAQDFHRFPRSDTLRPRNHQPMRLRLEHSPQRKGRVGLDKHDKIMINILPTNQSHGPCLHWSLTLDAEWIRIRMDFGLFGHGMQQAVAHSTRGSHIQLLIRHWISQGWAIWASVCVCEPLSLNLWPLQKLRDLRYQSAWRPWDAVRII